MPGRAWEASPSRIAPRPGAAGPPLVCFSAPAIPFPYPTDPPPASRASSSPPVGKVPLSRPGRQSVSCSRGRLCTTPQAIWATWQALLAVIRCSALRARKGGTAFCINFPLLSSKCLVSKQIPYQLTARIKISLPPVNFSQGGCEKYFLTEKGNIENRGLGMEIEAVGVSVTNRPVLEGELSGQDRAATSTDRRRVEMLQQRGSGL